MHLSRGATRGVLITKHLAIKFPRFWRDRKPFSLRALREGLEANSQERRWSRLSLPELCPVYFADPFGLIVVMPRCEDCPPLEPYIGLASKAICPAQHEVLRQRGLPVDNYAFNYGLLNGRTVCFDYGT